MDFKIDDIPASRSIDLSKSAYNGLDAFYADPGNRRRFEEWKKERERKNGTNDSR